MKIGVVLSGGMAKGAYQIGALKALREFLSPNQIEYMSCASVGVLNGYAYATDNLSGGEKMWQYLCEGQSKMLITQVLRSEKLQDIIMGLYDYSNTLTTHFHTSLFDFTNRNIVYKDLSIVEPDLLSSYLKASVAMPIYNRSVQLDGISYYDGAMIDNIPVFPLTKLDLDYIICIYFDDSCYKFESEEFDRKVIKVTFPIESVLRQSLVFRREKIDEMIDEGYKIAKEIFSSYFEHGVENIDFIYSKIAQERENDTSDFRFTGDVIVTNINKITQKLTRKKLQ